MINMHCGNTEIELFRDRIVVNGDEFTINELFGIFRAELGNKAAIRLEGRCGDNHFWLVVNSFANEEYHEIVVEPNYTLAPFEYLGRTINPKLERPA